jgi:nucleoid DNA-binding protein
VAANKTSLSRALKKAAGLSYQEAAFCVDFLVEAIAAETAGGGRVELRGLGSFSVTRTATKSFPASRSENKVIPAHGKVTFRPSEKLRRAVWDHGPSLRADARHSERAPVIAGVPPSLRTDARHCAGTGTGVPPSLRAERSNPAEQ